MPVLKVTDLAFGRIRVPDLDVMEEFLTAFGMLRAARTPTALYMRGSDSPHHLHVVEKGETGFLGLAFHVGSEEDLRRATSIEGARGIENIDEPGGGRRVRLTEPNGYAIELIHGQATHAPIPVERQLLNSGAEPLRRAGQALRLKPEPAPVKRVGHAVMGSPRPEETIAWFRETLGLICSDDVWAGSPDNLIGSFNRIDGGERFVDHHVFFCIRMPRAGLNHMSYEVADVDAVFAGHEHIGGKGKYRHAWGVGRHLLGSQVYDYWYSPFDIVHERWADTDRFTAATPPQSWSAEKGLISQWGTPPPESFIGHLTP